MGSFNGGGLDAGVDDLRGGRGGLLLWVEVRWGLGRDEVGVLGCRGWGILESLMGIFGLGEDSGGDVSEHLAEVSEGGGQFLKFPNDQMAKLPNGEDERGEWGIGNCRSDWVQRALGA